MTSKEIQGFKVVSVVFSSKSTTFHELFIKEHSLRHQEDNKPPGRTLFVLNIPPYVTEENLKNLFSPCGKVLNVILQNKNQFNNAYVIFSQREHLLKAVKVTNLCLNDLKSGLEKWIDEYNNSIEDPTKLSNEINNFMLRFDKNEEAGKKKVEEIDDEGWTVVTKKSRNPGIANKESVKIKINEKISQASKKKELQNFYTFQIKQSKQKNLTMLRKNYEEAKKKVTLMKSSRRFKPY
ncbi:unnamed protein product [Ceutorhynchus assimilis]|uniref:RRM domain-containing protein n=1 Tax=Ceutorhynchus assimilis TaxID=467358 RepID=A0A9N9MNY2_9CUCU|nr:unnamed protein product [Ceutorhynchus assimilis]